MALDVRQARELLQSFEFSKLFVEILGWSNPTSTRASQIEIEEQDYQYRMIAQLSGVAAVGWVQRSVTQQKSGVGRSPVGFCFAAPTLPNPNLTQY